jgi:hypothetical protein
MRCSQWLHTVVKAVSVSLPAAVRKAKINTDVIADKNL